MLKVIITYNVILLIAIRLNELFLSIVIVTFVTPSAFMPSATILSVIKRSVITLNVVAPIGGTKRGNLLHFRKFFWSLSEFLLSHPRVSIIFFQQKRLRIFSTQAVENVIKLFTAVTYDFS